MVVVVWRDVESINGLIILGVLHLLVCSCVWCWYHCFSFTFIEHVRNYKFHRELLQSTVKVMKLLRLWYQTCHAHKITVC